MKKKILIKGVLSLTAGDLVDLLAGTRDIINQAKEKLSGNSIYFNDIVEARKKIEEADEKIYFYIKLFKKLE